MRHEQADVVVVGCGPAGASTAITLAQRGRRVIVLSGATLRSDTAAPRVMTPRAVAALRGLGALDRVLATGAPPLKLVRLGAEGDESAAHCPSPEGCGFGISVRRAELDAALLDTARESGTDVWEGARAVGPMWAGGRLAGVRATTESGEDIQVRARVVIGADGRRSTVAGWVGSAEPYRSLPNGLGMVWRFVDDPRPARDSLLRTRVENTIGYHIPCNDGALVVLVAPRDDIARFSADPDGLRGGQLALHPRLAELVHGADGRKEQWCTEELAGYFRLSSGPGWALVGSAGQFTDPVAGQGTQDGLVWGQVLGEKLTAALDKDDRSIDEGLRAYERERDLGVLPSAYFGGNAWSSARAPVGSRDLQLGIAFRVDQAQIAMRGRARTATARRWRDGWTDATVLGGRRIDVTNREMP